MRNYNFSSSAGTQRQVFSATITPLAPVAELVVFNVANSEKISIAFAVTVAALTDVQIYARSDTNSEWFQITTEELYGYGRSDNSGDYQHTPPGVSGIVALATDIWAEVSFRASSAGAARLAITAGVE